MSPWKPDPLIKKALSSGPRMFAFIVLPFIEKYGDEAKKLVYDTVYQASFKRGQEMAKKASDVNDLMEFERLQIQALLDKGYNTPSFDDPARHWTVKTKHRCIFDLAGAGGCEIGIPDVWKDMGLDDDTIRMLGELLCEPGDLGVRKGFNSKIDFKFTKLAPRGDPYCEWCEEIRE
ncbi:MAG: L-2-amino-thiazoline-4-carboxylic acid hydrolase [Candidatus Ranarchaeia archaeon]